MLQTHEMGTLFATMQASYGHRWAHKADAIPVWQRKLERFSFDRVMWAADQSPDVSPEHPPSVGQFVGICEGRHRTPAWNTPKLPPPETPDMLRHANLCLIKVLLLVGGVQRAETLDLMIAAKNAWTEDHAEFTEAAKAELERDLQGFAEDERKLA